MKRRDWMLTGAMLTFGGAGLTCWTAGGTLSMFGVLPLTVALAAFIELVHRSLRPEPQARATYRHVAPEPVCPGCVVEWGDCEHA